MFSMVKMPEWSLGGQYINLVDVDNTIADDGMRMAWCYQQATGREPVFSGDYPQRQGGFQEGEEEKFLGLYLSERFLDIDTAMPGSREFLDRSYKCGDGIVYLTGRPRRMESGTRNWLRENRYPTGERTALWMLGGKTYRLRDIREFKAVASAQLRERAAVLEAGAIRAFGDRQDDLMAYQEAGLGEQPHQIIIINPNLSQTDGVLVVASWLEMEERDGRVVRVEVPAGTDKNGQSR